VSPITVILLLECIILGFILWNDEAYNIFKTIIKKQSTLKNTNTVAEVTTLGAGGEPSGMLALLGEGKKDKPEATPEDEVPKKFQCNVEGCDKSSSTLAGLMAHHRGAHKDIDWDELYE